MASCCGLDRSCLANSMRSFSALTILRLRKADSCWSRRSRMCLACCFLCCLRCLRISEGRGPKESDSGVAGGGSVLGVVATAKAEKAVFVVIADSDVIVDLVLCVFFPRTVIQSSLRPPPRHSSSSSNLYLGTKGISITSSQIFLGRNTFKALLK